MKRIYTRTNVLLLGLCICAVAITGCMVGPDYKPSEPNAPAGWVGPKTSADSNQIKVSEQEIVHWWTVFGDPNLTSLVERAVKSNLDLKQAESVIRQARATRGVTASGLWPVADVMASRTRSFSSNTGNAGSSSSSTGKATSLYKVGLDASWEVDIFGGTRRDIEAATADVLTAVEDRNDVMVTLTSEVALNYIDLRGFQQQIVIAQENLELQKRSAEITRKRFVGGFVGALDVANADAQVATTAAQIPLLESSARQSIYSLSILLGKEPAALVEELSPTAKIPPVPPSVPSGVPSDLLRRRPDIRSAEAKIHGATARIGVATADLFPKLSLTASGGTQGNKFSSLPEWKNRFWSFGTLVDWQIFNAGKVSYNIELQKASQEESVITYRKTVLIALQDVENALIASAKEQEHRETLVEAVTANRKAVDLSTKLYTEGQTDFLNVLVAQRSLATSEDALVQSTRTVSTNLVALYKALGGGWSD